MEYIIAEHAKGLGRITAPNLELSSLLPSFTVCLIVLATRNERPEGRTKPGRPCSVPGWYRACCRWAYLVHLEYCTLNHRPLMVYPKVLYLQTLCPGVCAAV